MGGCGGCPHGRMVTEHRTLPGVPGGVHYLIIFSALLVTFYLSFQTQPIKQSKKSSTLGHPSPRLKWNSATPPTPKVR